MGDAVVMGAQAETQGPTDPFDLKALRADPFDPKALRADLGTTQRDPVTLNIQQALYALYALQDWYRVLHQGYQPKPGWFAHHGIVVGIVSENRKLAARLIRRTTCLSCEKPLPADSTGDHLLALANGGPPGIGNFIPLCGRCNSSKATSDFLDWWARRGRTVQELPTDVLASYARLTFQYAKDRQLLGKPASAKLVSAVNELLEALPGPEYRSALMWRVSQISGKEWPLNWIE